MTDAELVARYKMALEAIAKTYNYTTAPTLAMIAIEALKK